ncbi:MAG: UDP-N-acetylmuramate:L-alanyl-gamma-D-glutamyl-meso-diaminopimelate ligase [Gammaproteobacteria bacterium]|nr:UDP-N-acetylmuramate:L-alanyl-gamma-D-glutamyl-meso-diaminopimelate ligase [Gammaproteobacteria bacterium]
MKIHILGVCGSFMGGIALLARGRGHAVTGTDADAYPPMSLQLQEAGIRIYQGYSAASFDERPDLVIIGNALSRGNPCVEYVLDSGLPYVSGPQWLREEVLADKYVLAVSGTHGKSTTTSLLAWILEYAGLRPGFLVGAVPHDFGVSARLGGGEYFVVEADEYDCAFFDKRAKFLHYRPKTLVITNIEYDHADIFSDLAAIRREFHHLIRTIPKSGTVICSATDAEIGKVLDMGCWTPVERFGAGRSDWLVTPESEDYSVFSIQHQPQGGIARINWSLLGHHNADNAVAAAAAAHSVGVPVSTAGSGLNRFRGVQRRLQRIGSPRGITVYDDFAHHPTAIRATLESLRRHVGNAPIIAVMEPRSNTMKLGVHADDLAPSFKAADRAFILHPPKLSWDLRKAVAGGPVPCRVAENVDEIIGAIVDIARPGDHVLIMSNGNFGGIHQRLLEALK